MGADQIVDQVRVPLRRSSATAAMVPGVDTGSFEGDFCMISFDPFFCSCLLDRTFVSYTTLAKVLALSQPQFRSSLRNG